MDEVIGQYAHKRFTHAQALKALETRQYTAVCEPK